MSSTDLAPLGTSEQDDALLQQFYTAAQASGTGSAALDLLLAKGLYGAKLPKELRSKRAAEGFQAAFELIGGIPRLALWADKHESEFFSLYSKLIPSSVKADISATIKIDAPWMNPNRLGYREQRTLDLAADQVTDVTPKDKG